MVNAFLRIGLWFIAVTQTLVGAVQLLLPQTFYDDFPFPGHNWVSLLPPYNEHLMRDVGALNLSLAVVAIFAAISMERRLSIATLLGYLAFSLPHAIFHAGHLEHFPAGDAITQTVLLFFAVILPIALLVPAVRAANPGKSRDRTAVSSRP
jgi:hypothetical protein